MAFCGFLAAVPLATINTMYGIAIFAVIFAIGLVAIYGMKPNASVKVPLKKYVVIAAIIIALGAKSIDDSKLAIKKTVDLMRTVDTDIPEEFEIKIQNIVASANLESTLNLEAVALELEDTEYEPEQFPGLVYRLSDPKVVLLLFGSGKVVCTGAKTKSDAKLGVERAYDRLSELDLI